MAMPNPYSEQVIQVIYGNAKPLQQTGYSGYLIYDPKSDKITFQTDLYGDITPREFELKLDWKGGRSPSNSLN